MKGFIKISILIIVGIIIGVMITIYTSDFLNKREYYILKSDYCLENGSILKAGTLLKFDKGFSEGFSRYILYINYKGDDLEISPQKRNDIIIPFWLIPRSICDTIH